MERDRWEALGEVPEEPLWAIDPSDDTHQIEAVDPSMSRRLWRAMTLLTLLKRLSPL